MNSTIGKRILYMAVGGAGYALLFSINWKLAVAAFLIEVDIGYYGSPKE